MKYTTVKTWQRGDWNSLHFHYNYTKIVKSNPTRTFTPIQALHRVRFREWKRNTFTCSSNTTGTWNAPMIKVLGTDRHERNLDRHVRDTQRYYDTDRKKKKKKEKKEGWSEGEAVERKGEERRAHTRFEKRLPILDQRKMARCDEKAREEKPPTVGGHRSSQNSPRDFSRYRFRFFLLSLFSFSFLCLHSCQTFVVIERTTPKRKEYNSTRELWLVINGDGLRSSGHVITCCRHSKL